MRLSMVAGASAFFMFSLAVNAQVPATPPTPQGQQDMLRMLHRAGHNQLGVLQYCQSQGSIGADMLDLQRRLLGVLPPMQVDGLDEAEAMGRRGVVDFAGNQVALTDAAKAQNTTADAMCKQIATMLQTQAAQLPK